jgi:hypothetical protein
MAEISKTERVLVVLEGIARLFLADSQGKGRADLDVAP